MRKIVAILFILITLPVLPQDKKIYSIHLEDVSIKEFSEYISELSGHHIYCKPAESEGILCLRPAGCIPGHQPAAQPAAAGKDIQIHRRGAGEDFYQALITGQPSGTRLTIENPYPGRSTRRPRPDRSPQ